jgi:hypothetical protein
MILKSKDLSINKELSLKEKIKYVNELGKKYPTLNLLINLENQGLGHISITEVLDSIATNTKVELPNRERSLIIE